MGAERKRENGEKEMKEKRDNPYLYYPQS